MRVAMPLVSVIMLAECVDVSIAAGHLVGVSIGDVFGMDVLHGNAMIIGMDRAIHVVSSRVASRAARRAEASFQ